MVFVVRAKMHSSGDFGGDAISRSNDSGMSRSGYRSRSCRSNECAPTQIFQHEYYFRLTGNNIGDPDRLMVQAFTYSKNISLSPLESRRHEQERKREILHPSHLVSAGEPTNNFAFTSRYRVSENTQKGLPPLHRTAFHGCGPTQEQLTEGQGISPTGRLPSLVRGSTRFDYRLAL
jgi:hypothetical protein